MRRSLFVEEFFRKNAFEWKNDEYRRESLASSSAFSWEFFDEFNIIPDITNINIPWQFFNRQYSISDDGKFAFEISMFENPTFPEEFFRLHMNDIDISQFFQSKDGRLDDRISGMFRNSNLSYNFLLEMINKIVAYRPLIDQGKIRKDIEKYLILSPHTPYAAVSGIISRLTASINSDLKLVAESPHITSFLNSLSKKFITNDREFFLRLLTNSRVPNSFFLEYWSVIKKDPFLVENYLISSRVSQEFIKQFLRENHDDENGIEDTMFIFSNPNLTTKFLNDMIDGLPEVEDEIWLRLTRNNGIPWQFFDLHFERIKRVFLKENTESRAYREIKEFFSANPNIPLIFYERHSEIISWSHLCANKFTYQFNIEEYTTEEEIIRKTREILYSGHHETIPQNLPEAVLDILHNEIGALQNRAYGSKK